MVHRFKSFFTTARLRAAAIVVMILAFAGCESNDSFSPESNVPEGNVAPDVSGSAVAAVPEVASASFAGGIPFGNFDQPITEFGSIFNGAHANSSPNVLMSELSAIKARGGKVVLALSGSPKYYVDGDGHFSMTKWRDRVNRFKGVNFSSYINDGTVIGHYMIDEPNDPANWGGRPVTPSVLEDMAQYSKQLWPNLATIVRVDPKYLGSTHRYLDAAWAQYLSRRGPVNDYIKTMVAEAQRKGLQLVVGMNVLKGGVPNGTQMSASEVENFGSALLSSTYPCAFINWEYNSSYMNNSSIKSSMSSLRRKAENRSSKSCRS